MSRLQHDQVIDDEEPETCPLCIEEFDLSDRSFYPCLCGYQICQFCYNNIKTTMNGLCPACRRPYDDKNIKWEAPSAEEQAKYKENQAQQAKRKAAARQKEAQRREADTLSRKHLAGIRVRRQNLVYVTGLRLNTSDPTLSEKLRGDQFFGQYGKIDKIVVNKPKDSRSMQPVGVYITYFDRDAAALCINMVNGTQNAGGVIRADYGTTKYCSAYLRNETCTNRNCTFLHEAGEENESFTREGLSSLNASSSQSPTVTSTNQAPPPPPAKPLPPSLTAPLMDRQDSKDGAGSPVDSSDGSALPSTASWAHRNISRRSSQAQSQTASNTAPSPAPVPAVPVSLSAEEPAVEESKISTPASRTPAAPPGLENVRVQTPRVIEEVLPTRPVSPSYEIIKKCILSGDFKFVFDMERFENDQRTLTFIDTFPPLWDANGGAKRQILRKQEMERARVENDRQVASQALSAIDPEEQVEGLGGSLQLGGEPDEQENLDPNMQQHAIQPPSAGGFGTSLTDQQQQRQFLLQQLKSATPNPPTASHPPPGVSGHTRQASRFSFANDTATASASVKPVANQKMMNQQSSMMPPQHVTQYGAFPQRQSSGQVFPSGVPGPPPGLKATGTPSVSGGGMFGQGHGFASAGLGYGVNSSGRTANDEMMRELLRNRGGSTGGGQTPEGSRADLADPSILQARMQRQAIGSGQNVYGPGQGQVQDALSKLTPLKDDPFVETSRSSSFAFPRLDETSRKSTPSVPPGLAPPPGLSSFASFSGTSKYSSDDIKEDVPTFSGLGVAPPNDQVIERKNSGPSLPTPVEQKNLRTPSYTATTQTEETTAAPETSSPAVTDNAAFPALPKPTLPTTASSSRQTKAEKAAERALARMQRDAKEKPKEEKIVEVTEKSERDVDRSEAVATKEEPAALTPVKRQQRQHPGKLDIPTAASMLASETQSPASVAVTASKPGTPQPPASTSIAPWATSRPATPGATTPAETPVKRAQPRTIRVLATPTPKTETPPLPPAVNEIKASTPLGRPSPAGSAQPSRQGSIVSIDIPGTPTSERISDTISISTDAISRADSPPPGINRVGTAPVRAKTKSQVKKERQERAKAEEQKVIDAQTVGTPVETIVQEPIMGRKKKTKKPVANTGTAVSTPDISRAPSPGPAATSTVPLPVVKEAVKKENVAPSPSTAQGNVKKEAVATPGVQEPSAQATIKPETSAASTAKASGPSATPPKAVESPAQKPASPSPSPKPKATTPAAVLAELEASGQIDPQMLEALKNFPGFNFRHDLTAADLAGIDPINQVPLTEEELAKLDAGEPVRRGGDNDRVFTRLMVTPNHTALNALTKEIESRFLDLEEKIKATKPPKRYSHKSINSAAAQVHNFVNDVFKDAAAQLLQPLTSDIASTTPNAQPGSAEQPSAVYGDEVLAYLNQFIMPVPTSSSTTPTTRKTTTARQSKRAHSSSTPLSTSNEPAALQMQAEYMNSLAQQAHSLASDALGDLASSSAGSRMGNRKLNQAFQTVVQGVSQIYDGYRNQVEAQTAAASAADRRTEIELEREFVARRKETERLEKQMGQIVRRNRKLAGI